MDFNSKKQAVSYLNKNYGNFNHPIGFMPLSELHRVFRKYLTIKQLQDILIRHKDYVNTRTSRARKVYNPIMIYKPRRTLAMDIFYLPKSLVEAQKDTSPFKYGLLLQDIFTRYAWIVLTKDRSSKVITQAFKHIFTKQIPYFKSFTYLLCDMDTAFLSQSEFRTKILDKYKLRMIHPRTFTHVSTVERLIRTIKNLIKKRFLNKEEQFEPAMLGEIVAKYNTLPHRSLNGKSPAFVESNIDKGSISMVKRFQERRFNKLMYPYSSRVRTKALKTTLRRPRSQNRWNHRFKVNDICKIHSEQSLIKKEVTSRTWSRELFRIVKIIKRGLILNTYLLSSLSGEIIGGPFYARELMPIVKPTYQKTNKKWKYKKLDFNFSHRSSKALEYQTLHSESRLKPPKKDLVRVHFDDDTYAICLKKHVKKGFYEFPPLSKLTLY